MNDTIVANQQVIEAFQHDSSYDYPRELVADNSTNLFEKIMDEISSWLSHDSMEIQRVANYKVVWWILGIILALLLLWLLWHARFKLFRRTEKAEDDYEVTVDDIHELDFDQLIADAKSQGNHLAVCRLIYLRTLKGVSDAGLVDWQRYKTPSQYAQEMNDSEFRTMTNHFLRVRYGNFEADHTLAQEMEHLETNVMQRVEASIQARQESDQQSAEASQDTAKGGEA